LILQVNRQSEKYKIQNLYVIGNIDELGHLKFDIFILIKREYYRLDSDDFSRDSLILLPVIYSQ